MVRLTFKTPKDKTFLGRARKLLTQLSKLGASKTKDSESGVKRKRVYVEDADGAKVQRLKPYSRYWHSLAYKQARAHLSFRCCGNCAGPVIEGSACPRCGFNVLSTEDLWQNDIRGAE